MACFHRQQPRCMDTRSLTMSEAKCTYCCSILPDKCTSSTGFHRTDSRPQRIIISHEEGAWTVQLSCWACMYVLNGSEASVVYLCTAGLLHLSTIGGNLVYIVLVVALVGLLLTLELPPV